MNAWQEMRAFVGFDAADEACLSELGGCLTDADLATFADRFYDRLADFPEALAVFEDQAQVDRLHASMQAWIREILTGPWDDAYWQRHRRIGLRHVQVGLPERFVFVAMNRLREDLLESTATLPADRMQCARRAVTRLTDLELAVMSGTYMEAHERAELRTLQDLIVNNLPATVLCVDASGRVTAATHGSPLIIAPVEAGSHFTEVLPGSLVREARLTEMVLEARSGSTEVTLPRVEADGRHFRVTIVPLEHELAAVLIQVEELTDVVQAETRLQQAESLARLGSLAANVAHEVRNPLTAISTTLQVIAGTLQAGDPRFEVLTKVQQQVMRLDRLVNDLLGYARAPRPRLRPIDTRRVVEEAMHLSAVEAEVTTRGDPAVLADSELLQHVLVNLLQNARAASGPGGRVRVEVGPGATVVVGDDGPGVDPRVKDTLFQPFVTTKTQGTGLGLAISRKLVEAMGGSLALAEGSQDLPGAHFRVSLRSPARASPNDTEECIG